MKAQGSATVLHVKDVDESIRFYTDVLGFAEAFRFGDYAGMALNDVLIHLSGPASANKRAVGQGNIYITCDKIDDYYDKATQRGMTAQQPPNDYEYGMRDFVTEDPDGNLIAFGCQL